MTHIKHRHFFYRMSYRRWKQEVHARASKLVMDYLIKGTTGDQELDDKMPFKVLINRVHGDFYERNI